jgi:hypothetical protein
MQGKTEKNVTANMLLKLHTALAPIQDHSVLFFPDPGTEKSVKQIT